MLQPHCPEQRIISSLIENELAVTSETWVNLSMLVEIGRVVPTAVLVVKIEDHALADVDEEAGVDATSVRKQVSK